MEKTATTLNILAGFVELLPSDQICFDQLINLIEREYQKFGFWHLDTPIIERSEILLAKAGGETEKQIYRFNKGSNDLSLRFDLTIPLARYVANHYNQLKFPFKRYQIGKVYRGESPQKGRFREFYQADVDIIGHNELSSDYDFEMLLLVYEILKKLNLTKFIVKISHRQLLNAVITYLNLEDKKIAILRLIDKKDKIGHEKLINYWQELRLSAKQIEFLLKFTQISGLNKALNNLSSLPFQNLEAFKKGYADLTLINEKIKTLSLDSSCFIFDMSIARGFDYYTGLIFETNFIDYPQVGSICSGGRYDNLVSEYSQEKLPGVGFSIGLTRLFDQSKNLKLLNLIPKQTLDLLIIPLGYKNKALILAQNLRQQNLNVEVLLTDDNIKKKFKYADKRGVKWVLIIGEDEIKKQLLTLQNMDTGEKNLIAEGEIKAQII